MLATIKGVYENGQIVLEEQPETTDAVEVYVTFTKPIVPKPKKERVFGFGKGTILYMAPDFDEPLDELKDYM